MQQKKEVRTLLASSFKQLVLEKNIEKITIKEITDRAGVIRVTFYNHFQDKYELLEWICQEELVNPIRILLWNDMGEEALTFVFNNILRNRQFYMKAVRLEGQNSFESIVSSCFTNLVTDYLQEHSGTGRKKYLWLTPERVSHFYAQEFTYVLISWIRSGMDVPPEEMVQIFARLSKHSMIDLPQDL